MLLPARAEEKPRGEQGRAYMGPAAGISFVVLRINRATLRLGHLPSSPPAPRPPSHPTLSLVASPRSPSPRLDLSINLLFSLCAAPRIPTIVIRPYYVVGDTADPPALVRDRELSPSDRRFLGTSPSLGIRWRLRAHPFRSSKTLLVAMFHSSLDQLEQLDQLDQLELGIK